MFCSYYDNVHRQFVVRKRKLSVYLEEFLSPISTPVVVHNNYTYPFNCSYADDDPHRILGKWILGFLFEGNYLRHFLLTVDQEMDVTLFNSRNFHPMN